MHRITDNSQGLKKLFKILTVYQNLPPTSMKCFAAKPDLGAKTEKQSFILL